MKTKTIKNSIKKVTLTILATLSLFALISAYNAHKDAQMTAYAEANDCTWVYDYYINKLPVCK